MLSSWQSLLLREHLKCKIMQGGWCGCQELLLEFLSASQDPETWKEIHARQQAPSTARGALERVGHISAPWQRPPKGVSLSSPPVWGLLQLLSTRHNFCDDPRSHFLRAEVLKREGTFAQFLFLKIESMQPKGAQGAMAAVGRPTLLRADGGSPLPARCPPRGSRSPAPAGRTEAARKRSSDPAGAEEVVSASPGLMFQLLWWREQIAPQRLLSYGLACLPQWNVPGIPSSGGRGTGRKNRERHPIYAGKYGKCLNRGRLAALSHSPTETSLSFVWRKALCKDQKGQKKALIKF